MRVREREESPAGPPNSKPAHPRGPPKPNPSPIESPSPSLQRRQCPTPSPSPRARSPSPSARQHPTSSLPWCRHPHPPLAPCSRRRLAAVLRPTSMAAAPRLAASASPSSPVPAVLLCRAPPAAALLHHHAPLPPHHSPESLVRVTPPSPSVGAPLPCCRPWIHASLHLSSNAVASSASGHAQPRVDFPDIFFREHNNCKPCCLRLQPV